MRKATLILLLVLMVLPCAGSGPLVRFGVMADIQYCDCEPWYGRHYRNSLAKLDAAVSVLNSQQVDFTVNLGDLVDRDFADMDTVLHYLGKLDGRLYNLTGNHDYARVGDNQLLYEKLGMPAPYYGFTAGDWLFLMLDTNDIASYSNMEGGDKHEELAAMRGRIEETGRDNSHAWNGGVGRRQLEDIKRMLFEADEAGMKVIVFTHNPLYPFNDHSALNDREILDILTAYASVKAVMSGHNHAGDFGYYGSLPCVTVRGMVETPDSASFGIVELYTDRIVIEGYGGMDSRTLDIGE